MKCSRREVGPLVSEPGRLSKANYNGISPLLSKSTRASGRARDRAEARPRRSLRDLADRQFAPCYAALDRL